MTPAARDLIELTRVVWEVEKRLPKRVSSERAAAIDLHFALRDPFRWDDEALSSLSLILRLMGNARWQIHPSQRLPGARTGLDTLAEKAGSHGLQQDPSAITDVSLFSGGLDSTCGLASLYDRAQTVALASYYGRQAKQRSVGQALGFENHFQLACQWGGPRERFGGQFQYRSLFFLAIAAALANSYAVGRIYQFENGPLACALPPSGIYRMTRHAHPALHHHASTLFGRIFVRPFEINNPFLSQTKRKAVEFLKDACRVRERLRWVLQLTETCWNLNSRSVLGVVKKANGQACGVCIPCIIRRTALDDDPVVVAADLRDSNVQYAADPLARVHLDAYLAWAETMLASTYSAEQFAIDLPQVTRQAAKYASGVLGGGRLFELYRLALHNRQEAAAATIAW